MNDNLDKKKVDSFIIYFDNIDDGVSFKRYMLSFKTFKTSEVLAYSRYRPQSIPNIIFSIYLVLTNLFV